MVVSEKFWMKDICSPDPISKLSDTQSDEASLPGIGQGTGMSATRSSTDWFGSRAVPLGHPSTGKTGRRSFLFLRFFKILPGLHSFVWQDDRYDVSYIRRPVPISGSRLRIF